MTNLLTRTLPMALTFLFGVCLSIPGQSETTPTIITATAIEASRAVMNAPHATRDAPASNTLPRPLEPQQVATGDPEPLAPPPARRLRVILDWFLTPYHAPLIVARERDLFIREGLEVVLTVPADPTVPPKLVAAQRAELALMSQPRLHLLSAQGMPLIRVGTLVPAPLATLMVREDSGIDTLGQLKGKTVGYVHEAPARLLLDGMLEGQTINLDDIDLQRIDFALTHLLVDGEADAVIGTLRHVARHQLAQEGISVIEYRVEESDIPAYDELILVANRDKLKQQRRDIAHFLVALEKATLWMINHPDQAWELVRKAEPGLDTEANARAWPEILRYLALRPALLQTQRYNRFERYMHQQALIDKLTPVERLAADLSTP